MHAARGSLSLHVKLKAKPTAPIAPTNVDCGCHDVVRSTHRIIAALQAISYDTKYVAQRMLNAAAVCARMPFAAITKPIQQPVFANKQTHTLHANSGQRMLEHADLKHRATRARVFKSAGLLKWSALSSGASLSGAAMMHLLYKTTNPRLFLANTHSRAPGLELRVVVRASFPCLEFSPWERAPDLSLGA